jgi:cell division septum initiation protein DivIVA
MDLEPLEQLENMIRKAKGVPLSSSVVIPRDDALAFVHALKESLPREAAQAMRVMADRDRVIEDARAEASRIVEDARNERLRIVAKTEVKRAADAEAARVVADAEAAASKLRTEADDYVDTKLANFEILLERTSKTVHRGRERLRRRLEAAAGEVVPLNLDDSGEISMEIPLDGHDQPGPGGLGE